MLEKEEVRDRERETQEGKDRKVKQREEDKNW